MTLKWEDNNFAMIFQSYYQTRKSYLQTCYHTIYIETGRDDVETTNSLDALNPLFNTGFSINSFKEKKEVRIPVFENVKNLSVSLELDCVRFVCVSHLFQICGSS